MAPGLRRDVSGSVGREDDAEPLQKAFPSARAGSAQRQTGEEVSADRLDVLTALRSLPERQREAAVLHYIVDCPVAVVAESMGISDGAVKAHLSKAREALRRSLEVRHA